MNTTVKWTFVKIVVKGWVPQILILTYTVLLFFKGCSCLFFMFSITCQTQLSDAKWFGKGAARVRSACLLAGHFPGISQFEVLS